MKEKGIQTLFGQQIRGLGIKGIFELKLCKGKSIRWDAVKEHQAKALTLAAGEGLYHKIQDTPVSATEGDSKFRFTKRKPFDCFFVRNMPAYVVICWYVPRQRKTLYFIKIADYVRNEAEAEQKSFREEKACEMAAHIHELRG